MAYVTCIFAIIVAFVFPVFAFFFFAKKFNGCGKTFLLGVWTFLVFQVFTRIPLLNLLGTQASFVALPSTAPFLYALIMGGSAALFEEGGRFVTMKIFMKKQNSAIHGLSFAIGHGGIEAILFVGLNAIILLLNGSISSGLVSALDMFWAGLERVFAMCSHFGFTMLVLYAVKLKKYLFLLFAFLAHTLLDFVVVILQLSGTSIAIIELAVAVFGLAMLFVALVLYKKIKILDTPIKLENNTISEG
ncbi:MAG: YhfC family glutamic-type intramembrane protease [Clostridia bacterium]